ncbi:MAG TPA: 3,4-dihydroxy-2-butanone-4-phosphate synthase, partial [Vicinamibacterales bacterium]|nr:3,4-dihydroxy-2-butanone-4-phosphate synthase [Vicinamibacterales bacterium]
MKKTPKGSGIRAQGSGGRAHAKPALALAAKNPASPFARIEDAVAAVRAGKMIIIVDDADRENEGDLMIAA